MRRFIVFISLITEYLQFNNLFQLSRMACRDIILQVQGFLLCLEIQIQESGVPV